MVWAFTSSCAPKQKARSINPKWLWSAYTHTHTLAEQMYFNLILLLFMPMHAIRNWLECLYKLEALYLTILSFLCLVCAFFPLLLDVFSVMKFVFMRIHCTHICGNVWLYTLFKCTHFTFLVWEICFLFLFLFVRLLLACNSLARRKCLTKVILAWMKCANNL